jgi:hypothetical protein
MGFGSHKKLGIETYTNPELAAAGKRVYESVKGCGMAVRVIDITCRRNNVDRDRR